MNKLTEIANEFGTDKGTMFREQHAFTEFYYPYLKHLKGKAINVLEIGVENGASLKMWKKFFGPYANIYAIDINPATQQYEETQIKIFMCDQSSRDSLRSFKEEIGDVRFDLIVDDGSHYMNDQIVSLYELYPMLKKDGIYILEDLHTSLWEYNTYDSTLDFLVKMNHTQYLNDDETKTLKNAINDKIIYFHSNPNNSTGSITSVITFK